MYLIVGTITWVVAQNLAVPLRPIRLRPALKEAKRKWKTFAWTGVLATMLPVAVSILIAVPVFGALFGILGLAFGFAAKAAVIAGVLTAIVAMVTFLLTNVRVMLVAAVVMMENRRGWQAIKRASQLVKRSIATATAAFLIMFIIPAATAGIISFVVNVTAQSVSKEANRSS